MATLAEQQSSGGGRHETRPRRPDHGILGNSLRLFTVGGIDVGVHASWLVIFGLVTWSLATSYFPDAAPRTGPVERWVLGAIAAILLFVSVLVHELAHSFVARARGLDVRSITLFIFGGVSNLSGEAKKPATEFLVAIVGPLTSFAIAGIAFVVASVVNNAPPVEAIASYLAVINLLLGGFNLIPGFPLDGGRVLRSIVWSATHSLRRATEVASGVGQLVAWGFMLWGFWRVLNNDVLGGIWIAAIGWFLQSAASSSLQQVVADQRLRRLRVGDVIRPDTTAVTPDTTVAQLIDHYMLPGAHTAVPVVDDDRPIGMVTLTHVQHVPSEERATTRVAQIMDGRDGLVTVTPRTSLREAIDLLAREDYEQLPVVDAGRLVGVLTHPDIVRQIQIREALEREAAKT